MRYLLLGNWVQKSGGGGNSSAPSGSSSKSPLTLCSASVLVRCTSSSKVCSAVAFNIVKSASAAVSCACLCSESVLASSAPMNLFRFSLLHTGQRILLGASESASVCWLFTYRSRYSRVNWCPQTRNVPVSTPSKGCSSVSGQHLTSNSSCIAKGTWRWLHAWSN